MTRWLLLSAALATACQSPTEDASVAPAAVTEAPEDAGPTDVEPEGLGRIHVGGAVIRVEYDGNEPPLPAEVMDAWVRRSARMVADYLGEFPVPSLEVTLVGRGWGGVGFGTHQDGRWITIYCGRHTTERGLENDWVMVHEMLHAAFPDLERRHRWMQEGLSTYLEPVVRARASNTTDEEVWRRWTRSMHHGRPADGDEGLDITHTWGRTYWGGALFWLMADVELRTQTNNRRSLRHVIQGLLREGGNGRVTWSTRRVIEVGDAATGTTVLRDLYARMAEAPGDVDLDQLYTELGVQRSDGQIFFDDQAPLAHVRRAITRE
ncbi:hypothetical protein [Paraliomyxa miuraensis]|uniref:hypothetical protein n=1 Tax=Paraliomyxa miuraensis TaxID=376150 RepID=UPI00225BA43D|nr:hypothetical protein [Paraliomyxa miuraensis]MCX4246886.1 hypothetical protein [Paraliomyxa miuraensis]